MIRRSSVFDEGRMKRFRSANAAGLIECNYWGSGADGSVAIATNTTWDSTASGEMIVKNFVNFTVNSGVTLTIKARKGCLIYVQGNFVNNGTIIVQSGYSCDPVTAGVSSSGLRIIRVKSGSTETSLSSDLSGCGSSAINAEAHQSAVSGNGKIYTIFRTGGNGANGNSGNGNSGSSGALLQSGGGGSGGGGTYSLGGAGATGTCFSGGPGGGAGAYSTSYPGGAGTACGGAGGNYRDSGGIYGGGGAGNPGGVNGGPNFNSGNPGSYGIGGLLMIFVKGNFTNAGIISSPGANGGNSKSNVMNYSAAGGGSGGGVILALYAGSLSNTGTVSSPGGSGGTCSGAYASTGNTGGPGGAGSILIEQISK